MVKEQILLTAFDLFSQYGIKKVSMDDIARSASISKRTLYEFFEDKESLVMAGMQLKEGKLSAYLEELEKAPHTTAVDVILLFYLELMKRPRWYNKQFYEDLKRFPKAFKNNEESKKVFIEKSKHLFERGIKEGIFRPDVNFEIMALLAKDQAKMLQPSKSFSNHSYREVYNTVLFTFLRGICTEKGKTVLNRYAVKLSYNLQ